MTAPRIRPGLCSVTYRQLAPEQIVPLTAAAGLETIEWGADVHVPAGDTSRAAQVAALTTDAGLVVASYGSYFRATERESITAVLDSAEALGADRIRVWAGTRGADEATDADWAGTAERLADAASAARARGLTLALEFHGGTLTDSASGTLRLLEAIGDPSITAYWQPRVGAADGAALVDFALIVDRVSAVHVFSWRPATERQRLAERASLWERLFAAAQTAERPPRDALIEFVPGDDPDLLAAEAATLRGWIDAASRLGA
ncbi:sugar phosphate isomerase/epimerase family protein [Microbacterium istanbulense]|uniref:TIM barrel protein n=1 Tax=Microbacterium istanbulense TaxID=3122049 RepID=A0ABU8LGF9_9MICO